MQQHCLYFRGWTTRDFYRVRFKIKHIYTPWTRRPSPGAVWETFGFQEPQLSSAAPCLQRSTRLVPRRCGSLLWIMHGVHTGKTPDCCGETEREQRARTFSVVMTKYPVDPQQSHYTHYTHSWAFFHSSLSWMFCLFIPYKIERETSGIYDQSYADKWNIYNCIIRSYVCLFGPHVQSISQWFKSMIKKSEVW